jgi:HD-like signal output (HDOD) protein
LKIAESVVPRGEQRVIVADRFGRDAEFEFPGKIKSDAELMHDVAADEIAHKINLDVALTAHLLKMPNSAAFGSTERISSTRDALSLAGTFRLKALMTTAWAFQRINQNTRVLGFNPKSGWDHALEVGNLCLTIAHETGIDIRKTEAAFTAGILHDTCSRLQDPQPDNSS